jgi:hypothetical protein
MVPLSKRLLPSRTSPWNLQMCSQLKLSSRLPKPLQPRLKSQLKIRCPPNKTTKTRLLLREMLSQQKKRL